MMGTLSPQGRLALSLEWGIWPSDARGVAQSVKGCTRRDIHQATWRAVFQAATALSSTNSKSDISNAGPSSGRAELPRAARQHCCLSRVPIGIGGCCNGPSLEAVGGEGQIEWARCGTDTSPTPREYVAGPLNFFLGHGIAQPTMGNGPTFSRRSQEASPYGHPSLLPTVDPRRDFSCYPSKYGEAGPKN